nr:hypothetical protein [Tanacetum cinerariifolium]
VGGYGVALGDDQARVGGVVDVVVGLEGQRDGARKATIGVAGGDGVAALRRYPR